MPSPLRESPGIILKLEWEPCENNTNVLESLNIVRFHSFPTVLLRLLLSVRPFPL